MQNAHPLIVHFPIAFLAAFAAATLLAFVVRRAGIERFARACLYVGTPAAAVAVVSGFFADQTVAPVAAAEGVLGKHRLAGYGVLALAAALTALHVVAPRHPGRAGLVRTLSLVGAIAIGGTLWFAAHEGGELVHDYGVGTRMTGPGGPLAETASPDAAPDTNAAPRPTGKDFR